MKKVNLFKTVVLSIKFLLFFALLAISFKSMAQVGGEDPTWCSRTPSKTIPSNTTRRLSQLYSPLGSNVNTLISNQTISLGVNSVLIIDFSCTFDNCDFQCSSGSQIYTQSKSNSLEYGSNNSRYYTCDHTMWAGITINPFCRIIFTSNSIYDALSAIKFAPQGSFTGNILESNNFFDDFIGLEAASGSSVDFNACDGNHFKQNSPLLKNSQYAQSGVQIDDSASMNFGNTGVVNTIENIRIGLYLVNNSSGKIVNCKFNQASHPGSNLPHEGTGIYANNSRLTVTDLGAYPCYFNENYSGGILVHGANGQVTIERAVFTGVNQGHEETFGIQYESPVMGPVNIQNNRFTLDAYYSTYAIYCERPPDNAVLSNISDNIITLPQPIMNMDPVGCQMVAAIKVAGLQASATEFDIFHNTIDFKCPCVFVSGIYISGQGDKFIVAKNKVNIDPSSDFLDGGYYNNYGSWGIALEDMKGAAIEINNNEVGSIIKHGIIPTYSTDDYQPQSFIHCGIHMSNFSQPYKVCSNLVYDTYRGIHFQNIQQPVNFSLNKMWRHVNGLELTSGAANGLPSNIGDQIFRGNDWAVSSANYIDGGLAATNREAIANPSSPFNNPFVIEYDHKYNPDPNNLSYTNRPLSSHPSSLVLLGDDNDHEDWCVGSLKPNPLSGHGTTVYKLIQNDFAGLESVSAWDYQKQIWESYYLDPSVFDGDESVADFFDRSKGNSAQLFAYAINAFHHASVPSDEIASQIAKIDDDIKNIKSTTSEIKIVDKKDTSAEEMNISLNTPEQLFIQLTVLKQQRSDLLERIKLDNQKNLKKVRTLVKSLPNNEPWENAWIQILNFGIKRLQDEEITTADRQNLIQIANDCPNISGQAVQSVLGYMLKEDAAKFMGREKLTECSTSKERSGSTNQSIGIQKLFPNPVSDLLYATINGTVGGRWTIISMTGEQVLTGNVPELQQQIQVDTYALIDGVYSFNINYADGTISQQKFVVLKR